MDGPLMVNRAAALLASKQLFSDCLASLPDPLTLTRGECEEYSSVYVIPECEDQKGKRRVLKRQFSKLFDEYLFGWWTIVDDWPDTKDYRLFTEWFQVTLFSMVLDAVESGIRRE